VDETMFQRHVDKITAEGYAFDPPEYAHLNPWTHVLVALSLALSLLNKLEEQTARMGNLDNIELSYSRFASAIVSYARCFGSAGPGIPCLDAKRVFANDPINRTSHERMIAIRHKMIAHTDQSDLVRVNFAVKEDEDHIYIEHLFTIQLPMNEVPGFLTAIERVHDFVAARLNQQLDALSTKKGRPINHGD
jgi:hypothetical protein